MSKRQDRRERRHRAQTRSRLIMVSLVVVGVVLIAAAIILPGYSKASNSINATQTAVNSASLPVVTIVPKSRSAKVDGRHLGDPNAPVKVDIYEDFRCSACLYYTQHYEPTIIQQYVDTGKVYYTYHTYTVIDQHDGTDASYRAANAALCAAAQNRFWDYHDTLYANQLTEDASLFTDQRLVTMAQNLNLDMTAFNKCYQAKQYANDVKQDIAQAEALGVNGTPSIFVNGKLVSSFDQTANAIAQALAGG